MRSAVVCRPLEYISKQHVQLDSVLPESEPERLKQRLVLGGLLTCWATSPSSDQNIRRLESDVKKLPVYFTFPTNSKHLEKKSTFFFTLFILTLLVSELHFEKENFKSDGGRKMFVKLRVTFFPHHLKKKYIYIISSYFRDFKGLNVRIGLSFIGEGQNQMVINNMLWPQTI